MVHSAPKGRFIPTELVARLELGPVYLSHKEAYDLAIFFGSDVALGLASLIRKAFAGGSLDAALALAERVLPGWTWIADGGGKSLATGVVIGEGEGDDPDPAFTGKARTPAIAMCIAILKAISANAQDGRGGG